MGRKKLVYTPLFPYHVVARANNRDSFPNSKLENWYIFCDQATKLICKSKALIHAFVLMDNHYHMLISAGDKADLGQAMCTLQTNVCRDINKRSGRVNHIFGGR